MAVVSSREGCPLCPLNRIIDSWMGGCETGTEIIIITVYFFYPLHVMFMA